MTERPPGSARRARATVFTAAAAVAVADLIVKAWARTGLPPEGIEGPVLSLRLTYNGGVAFGLGGHVSPGVIVALTALITAALAVVTWRATPQASRSRLSGLALILGGATANVADRARDGAVTDYLHTGWWPTFNLADVAIVTGAALVAMAALRGERAATSPPPAAESDQHAGPAPRPAPSTDS